MEVVLRFPIVIHPSEDDEGGRFTAHCLSMDVLADDDTIEGAVSDLLETIEAELEAAQKHDANVIREAPEEYWDKLRLGTPLPRELMERIVFSANKRPTKTRETYPFPKKQQSEVHAKYLKPLRRAFELLPENGVSDDEFFS